MYFLTATRGVGDRCDAKEYQCTSGDQCVPASYQCDGEIDCQDRSDEIGCGKYNSNQSIKCTVGS